MLSNSRWTASSILNSRSHANRKIVFKCWTEYSEMVLSVKLLTYLTTPQWYSPNDNPSVSRHNTYSFCMSSECQCTGWLRDLTSCCLGLSSPIMSWTVKPWVNEWGDHSLHTNKLLLAEYWVVRSTYHWFVSLSTCHSVTLSSGHNDL